MKWLRKRKLYIWGIGSLILGLISIVVFLFVFDKNRDLGRVFLAIFLLCVITSCFLFGLGISKYNPNLFKGSKQSNAKNQKFDDDEHFKQVEFFETMEDD